MLAVRTQMQVEAGIVDLVAELVVDGVVRSYWKRPLTTAVPTLRWTRHPREDPPWFGASVAIAGDLDQEDAMEQLRQWVLELETAGLLAELPNWRLVPAVDDESDD